MLSRLSSNLPIVHLHPVSIQPASNFRPEAGLLPLNWLCLALFFSALNSKYFHIPITNKHLSQFSYINIGFVFSN